CCARAPDAPSVATMTPTTAKARPARLNAATIILTSRIIRAVATLLRMGEGARPDSAPATRAQQRRARAEYMSIHEGVAWAKARKTTRTRAEGARCPTPRPLDKDAASPELLTPAVVLAQKLSADERVGIAADDPVAGDHIVGVDLL